MSDFSAGGGSAFGGSPTGLQLFFMDPYIQLAKQTIETYIKTGQIIKPPTNLPKEMLSNTAGVFVSIHQKDTEELRGCIGTFLPTKSNLAEEIISNAISAAARDPRFLPITEKELENLALSVDVLSRPEKIKSASELNPKKYGVIVKTTDGRSGLLLPDLETVNTVEQQLNIACRKARIGPQEEFTLYRFTVERHLE